MAALIPTDVGIRMRLPGDTGLAPTTPISDIPGDLPDLQPGQAFTARIQDILPENTYRALVAGKSLTLALPEGAKAGDVLELVVVDRTPQAIVARAATPDAGAATEAYRHTTLSPAAQLIGKLISDNSAEPQTTQLNRSVPILTAPPTQASAGQLAGALQKAVTESGMFYEAHQAQWIAGKRPLASLLQEPQGQWSRPETMARAAQEAAESGGQDRATTLQTAVNREMKADGGPTPANTVEQGGNATAVKTELQAIPDELRPLVHQQLEAAANQRLVWHGEVWPGQTMEWTVEEDKQGPTVSAEEAAPWQTTLRLSTPRLGQIEARLRISGNSLQLNLSTPVGASAADLRDDLPSLTDALAAVGISLQVAQVRHEPV